MTVELFTCWSCKANKSREDFYTRKFKLAGGASRVGRSYECKTCRREATKKQHADNPERKKETDRISRLKSDFGLTPDQFNEMHDSQLGRCAICTRPINRFAENEAGTRSQSHVDHDHATGEIRGLLCPQCNHGLGMFKDNPRALEIAARYVTLGGVP